MNKKKIGKCFEYAERENIKYVMIIGDNEIRWGKTSIYSVENENLCIVQVISEVTYSINNEELATIEQEDGICYIKANSKRKTGKIILSAIGENFSIEKQKKYY